MPSRHSPSLPNLEHQILGTDNAGTNAAAQGSHDWLIWLDRGEEEEPGTNASSSRSVNSGTQPDLRTWSEEQPEDVTGLPPIPTPAPTVVAHAPAVTDPYSYKTIDYEPFPAAVLKKQKQLQDRVSIKDESYGEVVATEDGTVNRVSSRVDPSVKATAIYRAAPQATKPHGNVQWQKLIKSSQYPYNPYHRLEALQQYYEEDVRYFLECAVDLLRRPESQDPQAPLAKLKEYVRDGEAVLLYLHQCNIKLHTPSIFELDGLEKLLYRLYKASKAVQAMIRMYAEASVRQEQQNNNYGYQEKENSLLSTIRFHQVVLSPGLSVSTDTVVPSSEHHISNIDNNVLGCRTLLSDNQIIETLPSLGNTSQLWQPCVSENLSSAAAGGGIPGQLEENQQLSQILLPSENEMNDMLKPYCCYQTTTGQADSGLVQHPITPPIGDLMPNQSFPSVVSPVYFANGSLQPSPIPLDEQMDFSISSSLVGSNLGPDVLASGDVNFNTWNVDPLDLTDIPGMNFQNFGHTQKPQQQHPTIGGSTTTVNLEQRTVPVPYVAMDMELLGDQKGEDRRIDNCQDDLASGTVPYTSASALNKYKEGGVLTITPGDLEEEPTGHNHPCMGLEPDNTGNTTPTNSAAAVNVEPILENII